MPAIVPLIPLLAMTINAAAVSSMDSPASDACGATYFIASPSLDGSTVTASCDNGLGDTVDDDEDFTIVKVNDPTPANPSIIVGHYPTNSLYTVVLTYTVSPAISGVPITFEFESWEGDGVNYAASLEDASSSTDGSGQATVRVRSSDLEETATVECTYQESSGSTDVTFLGLTDVTCP